MNSSTGGPLSFELAEVADGPKSGRAHTGRRQTDQIERLLGLATNLLARQPAQVHVLCDRGADRGQRLGEMDDVLELGLLTRFTVVGMVAVLLPPLGVAASRLDAPLRGRTDPA